MIDKIVSLPPPPPKDETVNNINFEQIERSYEAAENCFTNGDYNQCKKHLMTAIFYHLVSLGLISKMVAIDWTDFIDLTEYFDLETTESNSKKTPHISSIIPIMEFLASSDEVVFFVKCLKLLIRVLPSTKSYKNVEYLFFILQVLKFLDRVTNNKLDISKEKYEILTLLLFQADFLDKRYINPLCTYLLTFMNSQQTDPFCEIQPICSIIWAKLNIDLEFEDVKKNLQQALHNQLLKYQLVKDLQEPLLDHLIKSSILSIDSLTELLKNPQDAYLLATNLNEIALHYQKNFEFTTPEYADFYNFFYCKAVEIFQSISGTYPNLAQMAGIKAVQILFNIVNVTIELYSDPEEKLTKLDDMQNLLNNIASHPRNYRIQSKIYHKKIWILLNNLKRQEEAWTVILLANEFANYDENFPNFYKALFKDYLLREYSLQINKKISNNKAIEIAESLINTILMDSNIQKVYTEFYLTALITLFNERKSALVKKWIPDLENLLGKSPNNDVEKELKKLKRTVQYQPVNSVIINP